MYWLRRMAGPVVEAAAMVSVSGAQAQDHRWHCRCLDVAGRDLDGGNPPLAPR